MSGPMTPEQLAASLIADVPRQDFGIGAFWIREADVLAVLARAMGPGDDLAEAGKALEKTVWVVFNDAPNMGGAPAYVTRHDPRPLPLDRCEAVEFARADLITALLARIAAQEAQIKGLGAEAAATDDLMAADSCRIAALETALAAMTKERDELADRNKENSQLAEDNAQGLKEAETALAAERAKVAKLVEYYEASEAILSIEAEWRSRKADGLLDGSNIFNLTDKLTAAEARLAKARAAITEAGQ